MAKRDDLVIANKVKMNYIRAGFKVQKVRRDKLLGKIKPGAADDGDDSHEERTEELLRKWAVDEDEIEIDERGHLPGHLLIERRPERRRMIAGERKVEVDTLLGGKLPDAETDYYIIAAGRGKRVERDDIVRSFGFGNFIDFAADQMGDGCVVDMATWSMNQDHAFMLLEMLESGRLGRLRLLCDPSFTDRKKKIMTMLAGNMVRFPGSRFVICKNHSKVFCMRDRVGGRFLVAMGSANLSGTLRAENYTMTGNPAIYHYFIDNFFEAMFEGPSNDG